MRISCKHEYWGAQNLKFLAKLKNALSESFALLQQVYKEEKCQEFVLLNGTNGSDMVNNNVRTIKDLAGW